VDASPPVQALHDLTAVLRGGRFYRTCVIDGALDHSPADHVRRPVVPAESPSLGFTHLQFEALLTAARHSHHPSGLALVAMLGLLGLRIFEATSADITDLGEEHGHRVLRVCGKGTKVVLIPLPPAVGRAIDRAIGDRTHGPCSTTAGLGWTATPRPAACGGSLKPPVCELPRRIRTCCATRSLSVVLPAAEARRDQGLIASCLTNIRHSARHVPQSQDQGLSSSLLSFALRDSRASLFEIAIY
jgi:integrase